VGKRDGNDVQYQFHVGVGGKLYTRAAGEYGHGSIILSKNTWYHAAVVVNSSNYPELYVNGIKGTWVDEVGSRPYDYSHQAVNVSVGVRWANYPITAYRFNGLIDEVRIYNRALSAEEVKRLYNMGR
jgi:hypothetical protein